MSEMSMASYRIIVLRYPGDKATIERILGRAGLNYNIIILMIITEIVCKALSPIYSAPPKTYKIEDFGYTTLITSQKRQ